MYLDNYQCFLDKLLIVLVLYKRDLKASESFQSIIDSLKITDNSTSVFIYDNSPRPINSIDSSNELIVHYKTDISNPGVSKAYNEGFTYAKKNGKQWLLLLDQDTSFKDDFLQKYYDAFNNNPDIFLFAPILKLDSGEIYSPCKYKFPRTSILKKIDPGMKDIKNLSLLNSGILISASTFQEVGGYNEGLSLDFSDFEFLDRYRKIKDRFVVVDTEAVHGFSGVQDELDVSLLRFRRYCQSSLVMCSIHHSILDKIKLVTIALLRSIKLSLKFKSAKFAIIFVKIFIFQLNYQTRLK